MKSNFLNYLPIILLLFVVTSCGSSNSYLSQNYNTVQQRDNLEKLKVVLEKPIIVPEVVDLIDNSNEVLEKIESNTFTTKFEVAVSNIISEANTYIGTPYRYGGSTRRGIDCSAFMQRIFSVEGINLPRVSSSQAKIGVPVKRRNLQKGDLIFFSTTSPTRITHVGMVVDTEDDIEFIHAASSKGVSVASLSESYWSRKYRSARRPAELLDSSLISLEEAEKLLASNP